jgi:hypothetical protein
MVNSMNRIASNRISDGTLADASADSQEVCSGEKGALYAMWPTNLAGGELLYAMALAAAQRRVRELNRSRASEPSMN